MSTNDTPTPATVATDEYDERLGAIAWWWQHHGHRREWDAEEREAVGTDEGMIVVSYADAQRLPTTGQLLLALEQKAEHSFFFTVVLAPDHPAGAQQFVSVHRCDGQQSGVYRVQRRDAEPVAEADALAIAVDESECYEFAHLPVLLLFLGHLGITPAADWRYYEAADEAEHDAAIAWLMQPQGHVG